MMDKPKRGEDVPFDPIQASPCFNYGGSDFEWGILPQTRFQPGMRIRGIRSMVMLKGRRCLTCGSVVGFSDERFQKQVQQYSLRLALAITGFTLGITIMVLLIVFLIVGPS